MNRYKNLLLVSLLLASCSDNSAQFDASQQGNGSELRLQAEIDQINLTRADDSGFADKDVIGVYAVDFKGGKPGTLVSSGNNADNVAFTFDESSFKWNGARAIHFTDNNTPMDIYSYYPYRESVDNIEEFPFSVEADQSGDNATGKMSAYEASDFLWAKSAGIKASDPSTILIFKHSLASVRISLIKGSGFDDEEWNELEKTVLVGNTLRDASVNLRNGQVKATGLKDGRSILTKNERGDYRAIVIPQTVEAGADLIKITVGSQTYNFRKDVKMEYLPTKQHNFTIQVNKASSSGDFEFSLVDEAVTPWESDLSSHNGESKEYIVVNVPKNNSLESAVKTLSLDPSQIVNIKIIGELKDNDFVYIRSSMLQVESINMSEVELPEYTWFSDWGKFNKCLPQEAFAGMTTLRNFVFPKGLKYIGDKAFCGTGLAGSLTIPEGIIFIGEDAFRSSVDYIDYPFKNNLTGTLSLPSTLQKIGENAFLGCEFTGSLLLPEGLKTIGGAAFKDCKYFSGDLRIPDGLTFEDCWGAFDGMTGMSGRIKLPKDLRTIHPEMFVGNTIKFIEWPDNLNEIMRHAFRDCDIRCDMKIPQTVLSIEDYCFGGSNVKHVVLPSELTKISNGCFWGCSELTDTITIPGKVETIGEMAFMNCTMLEAAVLPSSLTRIYPGAFTSCFNLNYIRCNSIEPPVLEDGLWGVFDGVNKESVVVEVPQQSVNAYRNAPGWREFKKITAYRNFVASPSKFNVLNKGGKTEVVLNADADWEMIECPSWCSIDKKTGSKKTVLNLKVDPMAKGSQPRQGEITFRLKGNSDYLSHVNVSQQDYRYDEDEYITLQSATEGKGINLVFLGDGYDAFDIASGAYLADMEQEMEYFFGVEPFTTYRNYFNVYTAFALSEDSGVEELNIWRKTKFHVCIGDGDSKDGQRLKADYAAAFDYCAENVPPTINQSTPQVGCIIVSNSDIYEGVTYMLGDSFCSVVTKSTDAYPYDARGIVQHEAGGHGIGWLGDEYIYHKEFINLCSCKCCGHVDELMDDHLRGFSLNVSLKGKYNEVPWSHLIHNNHYSDIVDVYEGGYYHGRGVYRSEYNSCMNNNVPYFSTWGRQLIVQRIMKLAGQQFNLDSFYAKDSRETGSTFSGTSRSGISQAANGAMRHCNAPIRIKGYNYGQKGGKK